MEGWRTLHSFSACKKANCRWVTSLPSLDLWCSQQSCPQERRQHSFSTPMTLQFVPSISHQEGKVPEIRAEQGATHMNDQRLFASQEQLCSWMRKKNWMFNRKVIHRMHLYTVVEALNPFHSGAEYHHPNSRSSSSIEWSSQRVT